MHDEKLPKAFERYCSVDPFPQIPAALLNSADIEDYVRTVGIIDPFDSVQLKSGSYKISLSGEVHLWHPESKEKQIISVDKPGEKFTLDPNSIAYVFLGTKLYLPDYLALRFNLSITFVHRGLLLGTGPLVDPGFCGRLFIPLHNLTSRPYELSYGDGLIWAEFTKLSPHPRWSDRSGCEPILRVGKYVEFPTSKRFLEPSDYIDKATKGNSVVSSIPHAMKETERLAREAEGSANAAKNRVNLLTSFGAIGLVALGVAVWSFGGQLYEVYQASLGFVESSRTATDQKVQELQKEIAQLKSRVEGLEAKASKVVAVSPQRSADRLQEAGASKR